MATIAREISEDDADEVMSYEMVMQITAETRDLLSRLATESAGSEFDVIGKAVALYRLALEASRKGKKIGIFGEDLELEREIIGL